MKHSIRRSIIVEEFGLTKSTMRKLRPKNWKKMKKNLLARCRIKEHIKVVVIAKTQDDEFSMCLFCGQWFWGSMVWETSPKTVRDTIKYRGRLWT